MPSLVLELPLTHHCSCRHLHSKVAGRQDEGFIPPYPHLCLQYWNHRRHRFLTILAVLRQETMYHFDCWSFGNHGIWVIRFPRQFLLVGTNIYKDVLSSGQGFGHSRRKEQQDAVTKHLIMTWQAHLYRFLYTESNSLICDMMHPTLEEWLLFSQHAWPLFAYLNVNFIICTV